MMLMIHATADSYVPQAADAGPAVWASTPEVLPSRTVRVGSVLGLHLRSCSAIVTAVSRHRAQVLVRRGEQTANAASIFDLLSLAAPQGTELMLSAVGSEAREALDAVAGLLADEAA